MTPEASLPIEEIAGKPQVGIPMTEEQAYYLHEIIDPQIDVYIQNIDAEKKRRIESDAYQMRTIKELP